MAGISKEELAREQQKTRDALAEIKNLKVQISDLPHLLNTITKNDGEIKNLKEENSRLQSDNKALGKSGAVINSEASTFDLATKALNEGCKQLFKVNHTKNDWDVVYRFHPVGAGEPANYIIKYRDGKFKDSGLS